MTPAVKHTLECSLGPIFMTPAVKHMFECSLGPRVHDTCRQAYVRVQPRTRVHDTCCADRLSNTLHVETNSGMNLAILTAALYPLEMSGRKIEVHGSYTEFSSLFKSLYCHAHTLIIPHHCVFRCIVMYTLSLFLITVSLTVLSYTHSYYSSSLCHSLYCLAHTLIIPFPLAIFILKTNKIIDQ